MDDSTLTQLICSLLSDLPGWEWRPSGPAYVESEVALYYGAIKPTPHRAVGVRAYGGTDSADGSRPDQRRVQLIFRGPPDRPDGADVLAGFAFLRLTSLSRKRGINGISRTSWGQLGADDNGREERSDNYSITLDNPEALQ